ncbi:MAG: molecular chaperone HtpG [Flammeovirgaceae bacterium]|jgi:molecular chaperone HtpG|nr:molecular chaperone HtpG [Flammeovirgaceae bacterium]|tara:strand:- start:2546 stop:4438 length:1893 start_codon:yes stop_codon:yes gene_type:complete
MKEKGNISINTENIFPIIKKFLYSDQDIFLRELVSNAVDATQKIKSLSQMGDMKDELGDLTIEIILDKKKKTITISDKGIGMSADEIKKYINQIAFSGATEFIEKYKDKDDSSQIIGHFGLGFYSAFMVSKYVEIKSKSYITKNKSAYWKCDGNTEFEIKPSDKKERGTEIILHINDDSKDFLEESKVEEILKKYCRFLPVEIKFGQKETSVEDGKDKEGKPKYKSVKEDNIINNPNPIWNKSPKDLKDEDYKEFYKELHPFSEEPLFWIHLNVDYPFNLTGILFFPKIKNDFEVQKNKIQLYSRQVFITDEVKDVVPEFLMLLHGVIDSPDIPLNVSRSYLQSDGNVKKINSYITKKVADKLSELYKEDRDSYDEKWKDINLFVKYGMISEEKFYEKVEKIALLQSLDNKMRTFDEYKKFVSKTQKDKDKNTVILYSNDPEKQDSFIEEAKKRNYDIVLFDNVIDSHYINHIEQKIDKVQIKRVDSDILDKLIDKGEKKETVISDGEKESLKKIFEKIINNPSTVINVESLSINENPVVITLPEFFRRMQDMAKSSGNNPMMMGGPGEMVSVSINGNHKLIDKILKAKTNKTKEKIASQVYDLALLSQNMLTGSKLTGFVQRSIDILSK